MDLLWERLRPSRVLVCVLVLGALCKPGTVGAQGVVPGLVGVTTGFVGGVAVSMGIITVQARQGVYLSSVGDALGWEAAPIPVGAAAGLMLGVLDADRGRRALVGGLLGSAMGAGIGALIGDRRWPDTQGAWAGGLIGGSVGLLVGAVTGALLSAESGDSDLPLVQIRLAAP